MIATTIITSIRVKPLDLDLIGGTDDSSRAPAQRNKGSGGGTTCVGKLSGAVKVHPHE
jgi:hypothetical protein